MILGLALRSVFPAAIGGGQLSIPAVQEDREVGSREVKVVVDVREPLSRNDIRAVVGAKNVMGTCSG